MQPALFRYVNTVRWTGQRLVTRLDDRESAHSRPVNALATRVELHELLSRADFVVPLVPLSEETKHLVNYEFLWCATFHALIPLDLG